ncbi:LysR family transcriptional regulator [Saccharopolyspora sp. K220]|uniref:LysR family transcriptional regulator n=1 Tax=Saccharopolyspora soli TaxID=2926618 RepID=UPI001F56A358|nr:LysR family transcriptional regulator [Saccharopolyspora soli]MCI2416024.1 LysR family transcriptional regulator [Saccharopolyspora soli]
MRLRDANKFRIDWMISFAAVVRHGGFSAAAKALYRSQSRVSTHVADLEQALGTQLFDRSVHPPQLTPEGRVLRRHFDEILRRLEALTDVSAASGSVGGEVRLGLYPSAAAYLFPQVVLRLQRTHPGVSLVLHESHNRDLDSALHHGEVDLTVRPTLPVVRIDRFASSVLWREPLVAVFNRAHPNAATGGVRLRQLADEPLIVMGASTEGGGRQSEPNLAFANAGLTPNVVFRAMQPQTMVSLVRHGLGVGMTNSLSMTTANLDGVSLVPVVDADCDRVVAMWWCADQPRSAAIDAVREAILAVPPPQFSRNGGDQSVGVPAPSRSPELADVAMMSAPGDPTTQR